jgi:hypothetical protein
MLITGNHDRLSAMEIRSLRLYHNKFKYETGCRSEGVNTEDVNVSYVVNKM